MYITTYFRNTGNNLSTNLGTNINAANRKRRELKSKRKFNEEACNRFNTPPVKRRLRKTCNTQHTAASVTSFRST